MAIMIAQLVVKLALRRLHLAVDRLLVARRHVFGDLRFRTPQDEWAQRLGQQQTGLFVGIACAKSCKVEYRSRAEQSGVEKVEQRPQLAEVVFDRCAAQGQAVATAQQSRRL